MSTTNFGDLLLGRPAPTPAQYADDQQAALAYIHANAGGDVAEIIAALGIGGQS